MKSCWLKLGFFLVIVPVSLGVAAQEDVIKLESCMNESYKTQIDSLKQLFLGQGYEVVREASVKMESEYEFPIVLPLTQGAWYQFIFIGDPTSKLYEVRMYDWNEKQVCLQEKYVGRCGWQYYQLSLCFAVHRIPSYKTGTGKQAKKKNLCGYVMLLKKTKQ